jgi:hypothetical protein
MNPNKRIFNHYENALIRASELATEGKKIMVVGMDCETRKYHVMEKDAPELLETVQDEMDGETVDIERFINCINVHPNK